MQKKLDAFKKEEKTIQAVEATRQGALKAAESAALAAEATKKGLYSGFSYMSSYFVGAVNNKEEEMKKEEVVEAEAEGDDLASFEQAENADAEQKEEPLN